ncbi:MAG: hypothetical protein ACR2G0_11200 [Chthoniobacterales bacterium]
MNRHLSSLLVSLVLPATAATVLASGSTTTRPATRQSISAKADRGQTAATNNSTRAVADEPYNLGKALFGGKYKLGHPKLTESNVAEKYRRLVSVRRTLPASEREKLDPAVLSKRLTNGEMNALEYYLGVRFGKFITKAPSWAKTDPPPQVAVAQ